MEEFISSDYAPLGRFFCNPPERLFWHMLGKINQLQPKLDVLFITGDIIGHNKNNERGDPYDPEKYNTIMGVHRNISLMFNKGMPNTLVIPTFGNNDFDLDDEPANETTKHEFYGRIFKMWFEENPTNSKKMNLTAVNETFMNGGYYRVDLNDKLSVLALNTVMYLWKNEGMAE